MKKANKQVRLYFLALQKLLGRENVQPRWKRQNVNDNIRRQIKSCSRRLYEKKRHGRQQKRKSERRPNVRPRAKKLLAKKLRDRLERRLKKYKKRAKQSCAKLKLKEAYRVHAGQKH